MPVDEQRLIDAIAAGCRDAFESVYRSHKDRLLTATAFLLRGDRAAAEDVLHDVFLQLAEQAASVRLRGSLRNYLLTCCLNRARDHLRRQAAHGKSLAQLAGSAATGVEPSVRLDTQERETLIMRLLARLPDDQREVVTLHLHGELTFPEIADACGMSVNTAKSRYRYALDKLRQWWPADRVEAGET